MEVNSGAGKPQNAPRCPWKYMNEGKNKEDWYDMIQLLPSSYNQMRTCTMNYETLVNIYHARKAHKLVEWHTFCDWIGTLPYAKELIIAD